MKTIIRMSTHEFEDKYGTDLEDVSLKTRDEVECVYVSEDDENPFVGCKYTDGKYSIVGCGKDAFCTYETMVDMLTEEDTTSSMINQLSDLRMNTLDKAIDLFNEYLSLEPDKDQDEQLLAMIEQKRRVIQSCEVLMSELGI